MSRKRIATMAAIGVAALTAAGVAFAAHKVLSTHSAAADFAATTVAKQHTKTCTGSDGNYQDTDAVYTGNATSGDPRLSGTLTIHAHSVVNTSSGLGWLDGDYAVKNASGNAHGQVHAAISGGNAVGALSGNTGHPGGKLVASFISSFTQNGGFPSGHLGSGSVSGAGVIFTQGPCPASPPKPQPNVAVFRLDLNPHEAVPPSSAKAKGDGTLTLDLTRDSGGNITGANAVFYVNYHFAGSVTITDLALFQGAKGATGSKALDSGVASFTDSDGQGNVTHTVTGVSASLAQAVMANPKGYYVELDTSLGALRDQLEGPPKH